MPVSDLHREVAAVALRAAAWHGFVADPAQGFPPGRERPA